MKRQVEVPIFILGIVIWVVAIFLPVDSLEFVLGNGLRPLGLATIFICPILGIIGMLFYKKKYQLFLYLLISLRIADISLFYKVCRLFSFLQSTAELGLHYAYLHSQSLYISL